MLAASALIMVILGAGVCFALIGQDDPELEVQEDAEIPVEDGDDLRFLTIEDMLAENVADVLEAEVLDEDADPTLSDPLEDEDNLAPLPVAERAEMVPEPETSLEDDDVEPADTNLVSGGPGDTLTGTADVDRFEVTLATAEDEPTLIENFFSIEPSSDTPPQTDTEALLEKLWFRDEDGSVLSRDALFEENLTVEENDEINGVSLLFQARQTILISNITLAEFTENSLVIGNYGIQAA